MNEGWASYWHSTIMTEKALTDAEVIDYADHHSGTMAMRPTRLNPYKIGIELFRDIEERWNKGKFGKEYEECDDMVAQPRLGPEARPRPRRRSSRCAGSTTTSPSSTSSSPRSSASSTSSSSSQYNRTADQMEIASREFDKIKQQLLFQLTNFGHPIIDVVDGNFRNRGELLLKHTHEGVDLKDDYAHATLKNLYKLWRRPCGIETLVEGVPTRIMFDGTEVKEERV